jgi:hypothetical protein
MTQKKTHHTSYNNVVFPPNHRNICKYSLKDTLLLNRSYHTLVHTFFVKLRQVNTTRRMQVKTDSNNPNFEVSLTRVCFHDWTKTKIAKVLDLTDSKFNVDVIHWHDGGACPLDSRPIFEHKMLAENQCKRTACEDYKVVAPEIVMITKDASAVPRVEVPPTPMVEESTKVEEIIGSS